MCSWGQGQILPVSQSPFTILSGVFNWPKYSLKDELIRTYAEDLGHLIHLLKHSLSMCNGMQYWLSHCDAKDQLHLEHKLHNNNNNNVLLNQLVRQKHTAYLVPLSTIAMLCVRQKHFCCGKKMREGRERREEKRGRWSGAKRKTKRQVEKESLSLKQLSSRFEHFPGESNYRSISTPDKRNENKQKPAIPGCFPVLLCFRSPSGVNVGTVDTVWKILTLKKLLFDIHTI